MLDCKSLFDALTRVESSGLQLSERRTAIDVLAVKQRVPSVVPVGVRGGSAGIALFNIDAFSGQLFS